MKKLLVIVLAVASFVFAGCVPSLSPIYTKDTVVYDPNLVGTWTQDQGFKFIIEKGDLKSYKLTIEQGQSKNVFKVYLAKLDGSLIGDITPMATDSESVINSLSIPGHAFFKIESISPNLVIKSTDDDKLMDKLAAEPDMLKHVKLKGDRVIITASTAELQQFVKTNAKQDWLFGAELTLKRSSEAAPKADEKK